MTDVVWRHLAATVTDDGTDGQLAYRIGHWSNAAIASSLQTTSPLRCTAWLLQYT